MANVLQEIDGRLTFDQYAVSEYWTGSVDEDGFATLSATVETVANVPYELEFSIAANLAASITEVTVDIEYDGEVIGTVTQSGALYATQTFQLVGSGSPSTLTFRIVDASDDGNANINTDGIIPSYTKTVMFGAREVSVEAFAPGQSAVYQVLNGQLVKFDLEEKNYEVAEVAAAVNINAIGYNIEDDLIYGLARSSGVDATGVALANGDVVAIDATGATYRVGPSSSSSYIGDVDDAGNLWVFPANLRSATAIDVDQVGPNGSPTSTQYSLPGGDNLKGLADLAYHPASQSFYGVAHGGSNGADGALVRVDVSPVSVGGDPVITTTPITGTIREDGTQVDGIVSSAFGAVMVDADGNVYAGANNGDHDLDGSTPNSGGFYRVVTDEATDELKLQLVSSSPSVSSNDGAMDVRAFDPFLGIDATATVLLRAPELSIAIANDDWVSLSARGASVTLDPTENDSASPGQALTLVAVGGQAATPGSTIALGDGTELIVNADFSLTVFAPSQLTTTSQTIEYTVENEQGVSDTAEITILVSPVDGTAADDHMMPGYRDNDGNVIDGNDGDDDVILGYAGNDKIFSDDGNDLIFGGSGNDFVRGYKGDDEIIGGSGNDVLDGGEGADTMTGGAGNDVYYVDHLGDIVSEVGGDGYDKVKSTLSHVLDDGFELLWLIDGSDATDGTGNELDNTIIGNSNANILLGLLGRDNIIAGDGDDIVRGGSGDDKMHGNEGADALFGDDGDDKLHGGSGNDTVIGGDGDDTLCPGWGDDVLEGGAGHDLLSGGPGNDIARGGQGNDIYKIRDAGDVIEEYENEGQDVVHAKISYTLTEHVEMLRLLGSSDLDGTGNALANTITGTSGMNVLSGGGGDDTIKGGHGDDTLSGNDGNDWIGAGKGRDVVFGGAGDDNLRGSDGGDVYDGGAGNDIITARGDERGGNDLKGGLGDDRLKSGAGNDTLSGDDGEDWLSASRGADDLAGGAGDDVLLGGGGADTLAGGADDDNLFAGSGNDVLDGGAGADNLSGGHGADTFIFADGFGSDRILDFTVGSGDRIDLSSVPGVEDFADLIESHMIAVGQNIVIAHGSNTITIDNLSIADLVAGDFIL